MGTAERRLAIMKYLCRNRYATTTELAQEFNVSYRTIQRDIFELQFLMPLDIKPGRYIGGIYVKDNYTMDKMYMAEEQTALLIRIKAMVEKCLSDSEMNILNKLIYDYQKPAS